jgi:hypothetical protein
MSGFVTAFQAVFYERKPNAMFFLVIVKKCADMTCFGQVGPSNGNRCRGALHGLFLHMDVMQMQADRLQILELGLRGGFAFNLSDA